MQISGTNFLLELRGEVHPETAPLRAVCCDLRSPEQRALLKGRKGRKGAEKRGGRGVASKGGQEGKNTRKKKTSVKEFKVGLNLAK